jgi:hypothetical protein
MATDIASDYQPARGVSIPNWDTGGQFAAGDTEKPAQVSSQNSDGKGSVLFLKAIYGNYHQMSLRFALHG